MWILLLVLGIAALVSGSILHNGYDIDTGFGMMVISIIMMIVSFIGILVCTHSVISGRVVLEKIAMYEEENERIESDIATVIKQYQDYESEIFENATNESPITLVSLYPELKSDTLVQSQIDIYVENNNKIKELREQMINVSVNRWWLYFWR